MDRIPILKMGDFLLVTIQVDMHDRLAMAPAGRPDQRGWSSDRAKGVLIDISSLEMVDSFIGRMLANIAAMTRVAGRRDRGGRHAAGGGHHAGRAGAFADRASAPR